MSAASVIVIALAGAVGTALRYGTGVAMSSLLGGQYPLATLAVNVIGSALLAVVTETMGGQVLAGTDARLVLGVGLLGGFTTYSSFNLEVVRMLEQGMWARAAGYFTATVAGCLIAAAAGIVLARR